MSQEIKTEMDVIETDFAIASKEDRYKKIT